MNLFSTVRILEPMKSHIYEPNISLISLISQMLFFQECSVSGWMAFRLIEYKQKKIHAGIL